MESTLFSTGKLGGTETVNRIVMAPMTRSRADKNLAPTDLTVEYYTQRASAGLIVTEATQISPRGIGYTSTPGIYTMEQTKAWEKVTDSVHKAGGKIFSQLWHVGRVSHPSFHGGELPFAPSAIGIEGTVYTYEGPKQYETPKEMTLDEIKQTIQEYKQAAINAKAAGFDGVELHGANGYLPEQFLASESNKRTDEYGGSLENRAKFILEVMNELISVWGSDRVGIKLSPSSYNNSINDNNRKETWTYLVEKLNDLNLAYIMFMEPFAPSEDANFIPKVNEYFRGIYKGNIIANVGFNREKAIEYIESGISDYVAFGSLFISNPDLPRRLKENLPLALPDSSKFYGGDSEGYTDYKFYQS
jgi:N-ethylmaleimide reductase